MNIEPIQKAIEELETEKLRIEVVIYSLKDILERMKDGKITPKEFPFEKPANIKIPKVETEVNAFHRDLVEAMSKPDKFLDVPTILTDPTVPKVHRSRFDWSKGYKIWIDGNKERNTIYKIADELECTVSAVEYHVAKWKRGMNIPPPS